MGMDAVGAALEFQQAKLAQEIGTGVMKLSMDSMKKSAQAMTDMIDDSAAVARAAQPHLGSNLDIQV